MCVPPSFDAHAVRGASTSTLDATKRCTQTPPAYAFAMAPALLPQAPWVSRPRKYAIIATETRVTCTNNTHAVRHVCYWGNHLANR